MRSLVQLVFAALAGTILYIALFAFVVSKPLTVGFINDALEIKRHYAERAGPGKYIFTAGSNVLFSFRCETMEPILGRPCVNAALTAEIGLAYTLELLRPLTRRGDTVVLPLEYTFFPVDREGLTRGLTHPFRLTYDAASLATLPLSQVVASLAAFDFRYLVGALAEMGLAADGIQRRYGPHTLTPQGDVIGRTRAKSASYRAELESAEFWLPKKSDFRIAPATAEVLAKFLEWASSNGVRAIGTLPTTFDDRPVSPEIIARLRQFYESRGQHFFVPRNLSQYPRSCFYDTQFHLNEPCQIQHSRRFAEELRSFVTRKGMRFPDGR